MTITDFHGFRDGVRWRLTPAGVEIEGSGIERTRGQPTTVRKVWEAYGEMINRTARSYRVPCVLIVATICTESSGRADAVRLEPGYKSDEQTPNKISPGLMQTLISTARDTLRMSLDREWLLKPANSIEAGTAYIAKQAKSTGLDPPLVAAAYNAGSLIYQPGQRNRWKLKQFPIGTAEHCDRFVKFFNDAVFVLKDHPVPPAVGLDSLLGCAAAVSQSSGSRVAAVPAASSQTSAQDGTGRASTSTDRESSARSDTASATPALPRQSSVHGEITIKFGPKAKEADLTPYSRKVLEDILRSAELKSAEVSSTSRTPADQARVMYDNLEREGVAAQKRLYANPGDKVIDVYVKSKAAGRTPVQIKLDMEQKIRDLGPTNVSKHTADPKVLNVFDVAPSSIRDKRAFEKAVKEDNRVAKFLTPAQSDPAFHLEIPQKSQP
jgi:hypothetical protein